MKNYFISLLLLLLATAFIAGCSHPEKSFAKLNDLQNASIGAMTGSTGEQLVINRFPDATVKSFDDIMDAVTALKSNQLDAVITGFPAAMNVCKHNTDLQMLSEPVDYENTCIAIRKGNDELLATLNGIISKLKNDGTLDDMRRRWFKKDLGPYELADIKMPETGDILKIGTSATREPFCFVDENKNVTGHDGELARRISAKLGRPIEFSDMKFSALIPALQSKKIDLIIAGMTATEERSKSVDFTESYFKNSQVILVKKPTESQPTAESPEEGQQSADGNKMKTLDDIADKVVGVYEGTVHDAFVANKYPKAVIKRYNSSADMVLSLKTQKSDVALLDFISANILLKSNPELGILTNDVLTLPLGIGFNKNNPELREKFNRFLAASKANGVYDEIYQRWCVDDSEKAKMPEPNYSVNSVELKLAVAVADLPYVAYLNGRYVGFDIELLQKFAESEGYRMKTTTMEFSSLIAAMASGKADIIADGIAITEERQKQVAFSDPYMDFRTAAIALKTNIEVAPNTGKLKKLDDIANKSVGVYAGTIHDSFVEKHYPNANIQRFNSPADIILSLKTGKTDAVFFDLVSAKVILKSNPDIGILSDDALTLPVAVGFNKHNAKLRHEFNKYLKEIKSDGTYDTMHKRWFVDDPEKAEMPTFEFDKNGPAITLAVAVGDLPNSAIVNGEHVGFDIELVKTFAQRKGYNLKINTMEFPSLIAALSSGKADIIADGISITEERQKRIDFSDSYNLFKTAVLVLNKNLSSATDSKTAEETRTTKTAVVENTFFQDVAESFHSNIIQEKRYLLILDGLKTTMIISILSTLFGTLFGGLICFMRMSRRKILLIPSKIYISVLRGTPVLVVLMIIFYVVFASVDIDPVLVAVIAFGLNFAAYVSEMFRTGIEGVDRGQTEAGIAIGFSRVKTFIYIVMPQAVRRILPVYKGEMISLVKMTSIVGYIAVQDLTKASDIIRSRTFDAFFPLIMVAVLYFLISWLLMVLLGYVERKTNPKLKTSRA